MPYKEAEIKKLYYSIGEVAKMFGVSTSLIRYWEGEFANIKPRKNKKGNRLFMDSDIEAVHLVYHLVKEKGYKLEGAKEVLKQKGDVAERNFKVISSLKSLKKLLGDIKESL